MHPIVSALALVASAACLAGCDESPKSDAQYGEAVGIEIAAQGTAPALSIAVAMTKGHDVAAAVSSDSLGSAKPSRSAGGDGACVVQCRCSS